MIEAAQIFSRNKIDTMTREASSQMQEKYTAFSTYKSDAERDASGRSCSWSAATSSQYFNRDSEDQAIGWSDYRHMYTSELRNSGFDKSCRHTFGYAFHKTQVDTTHTGRLRERGSSFNFRESDVQGGTDPLLPVYGLTWPNANWYVDLNPPFVHATIPFNPNDQGFGPPNSDSEVCPPYDPIDDDENDNFIPSCRDNRVLYPSFGSGLNGRLSWSIGIPTVGVLTTTWNIGKNNRQYFTCTRSRTDEDSNSLFNSENIDTSATLASENNNQSYSNETTTTYHLVRKWGIITRRATTDNDAEEQAEGYSTGIANSQSERNTKATAYSQQRAESESVRHSESHYTRTERANDDMVMAKYGQINKHLSSLWDRIWANLIMLEKQFAAKPYGGKLNCPVKGASCLPVRRSWHDLKRVLQHA